VQREVGDHQVEALRRERQHLLVGRHGRAAVARGHARRQVAAHHADAPRAQHRRDHAAPADVERRGEPARGVVEPVEQPIRHLAQQVVHGRDTRGGTVAVQAHGATIEDPGIAHRAGCASRDVTCNRAAA